MKLEFISSKYLLMWHLLYETSINSDIHNLKQLLWSEYKKEYSELYSEKKQILNDLENYIPDNDLIYNALESSVYYRKVKQETNRYRLNLLEIWDSSSKLYIRELKKILKYDFDKEYKVYVLHPNLNVLETDFDKNIISVGKKITLRDKDSFLTYLIYKVLKNEFNDIRTEYRDILAAILELISINELYTRASGESKYNIGKNSLREIKEKIYPYWLMYLNVEPKDMEKYMIRDNIFFNINNYDYEKLLSSYDIFTFVNYIIRNRKQIFNKKNVGVETLDIETL